MKQNQAAMPLFEAMKRYSEDGALAFHTPGHKQGKGAAPALRSLITDEGLRMEVSLMAELDDLHEPTACIKEAQALAAELYGADESYFVINGTTGAIQAMIMAAVKPGEKIIVPRNAHRSIIGGIMLSGAMPVFLQPQVDAELGIAMGIAAESVRRAIAAHKEAKAVLVINPTYYGVASDLAAIAAIAHSNDMLLLVDEAHGDLMAILAKEGKGLTGVIHCFSGSWEMARELVRSGWYIGIDGPLTFKNAAKLPEVVCQVPLERLLIETDSPYLAPVPMRGKRNEPAHVTHVARKAAELRQMPFEEFAAATTKNARNLFGLA